MSNDTKRPANIQNQTSNSSQETALIGKETGLSPIGKVLASIKEVKTKQAESSKAAESLVGIILMSSPPLAMSVDSFAEMYPKDTSFYKSVIQKDGKTINPKKDASIIRAYCYVPEISGCLPFPDLEKVHTFMRLWNEADKPQKKDQVEKYYASREKSIIDMYPDLYKEFQKVVMHPIFYKYVESAPSLTALQYVTVKYTGDFDTYHTGIIEEAHSDYYMDFACKE